MNYRFSIWVHNWQLLFGCSWSGYSRVYALFGHAWISGYDIFSSCSANGRKSCKLLSITFSAFHIHVKATLFSFRFFVMITLFIYLKLKQGDKARVIQTVLFMSGINTLLQTLIGTRLPTVMGPSFAFIISVQSIITDFSSRIYQSDHQVWTSLFFLILEIILCWALFEKRN